MTKLGPPAASAPFHCAASPLGENEEAPPLYYKALIHAGKEYRFGTCYVCRRENTPLINYTGKLFLLREVCLSCAVQARKEAEAAESALYAAKSGGRIEERKSGS